MLPRSFPHFPELRTARLLLRQIVPADAAEVQKLRSGEALRYLPHLTEKSIDEHAAWIERVNGQIARNEALQWAITLKERPDLLQGTLCLWNVDPIAKRGEIGYHLATNLYRQGIMSEALSALIDFSKSIGLTALEAFTMPYNEPSIALLLKFGFARDTVAEARVSKEELAGNVVYTMLL